MVFQLAYFSAAKPGVGETDVHDILRTSSANNRRNGLSGMLILRDETFFQVLEGEKASVEETFQRISRDLRHSGLVRVVETEREERSFPNWSTGFEKFMHADVSTDIPFDSTDLSSNEAIENLKKKAPELISFMRSLYTRRGMRGAPRLD